MTHDFCEHLDEYGVLYIKAEASYHQCVNLLDNLVEEVENQDLAENLNQTLEEWLQETRELRETFAELVEDGEIELVQASSHLRKSHGGLSAMCGSCQHHLPRLEFHEFKQDREGIFTFRGHELPQPQSATS